MKAGKAFVVGVIGGAAMSTLMWMGRVMMDMLANLEMMLGTMITEEGPTDARSDYATGCFHVEYGNYGRGHGIRVAHRVRRHRRGDVRGSVAPETRSRRTAAAGVMSTMEPIGHTPWAIAEGYIPASSHGPEPIPRGTP